MNGIPIPAEYASSRLNASPGVVAASVRIEPKIGPTRVGPILGSILTLAATTPGDAFNLLLAYSAGIGIPFIVMGAFITQANGFVKKISKHLKYYMPILGSFIIILGILVFFNQLALIASFPLLNNLIIDV